MAHRSPTRDMLVVSGSTIRSVRSEESMSDGSKILECVERSHSWSSLSSEEKASFERWMEQARPIDLFLLLHQLKQTSASGSGRRRVRFAMEIEEETESD